jgi:hypothetical protein
MSCCSLFRCRGTGIADIDAAVRAALAAVFSKIGEQIIHRVILGGVNEGAADSAETHKARMPQLVQMKRQRGIGDVQASRNLTRGHSIWSCLDQQTKDGEAVLVGKGEQGGYSGYRFHISKIMEI